MDPINTGLPVLARSITRQDSTEMPAAEPVLLQYWRILVLRRWTVITVTAALASLALVLSLTMTPRYRTESRISVGKEDPAALGFKDSGNNSIDESEYNMELDAQAKIISSETLVLHTLRQLFIVKPAAAVTQNDADPNSLSIQPAAADEMATVEQYRSALDVSRIPHTPLFDIRFSSPDAATAARFVNQLVQVYIEQNFATRYESTRRVSSWLSKQLKDLKANIEGSQAKLAAFQKQTGILGADDKQNIITQKLDDLNRELTIAQEDRMQKEALYQASGSADVELMPGAPDNPIIKQLKDQQAQVANNYAQATAQMGAAHPKVLELNNQLRQLDGALHTEFRKIGERHKNAYLIALGREKMLQAALNEQKLAANQLNERAMEYQILKHEVETNQQLYDGLSRRLKEAALSAGLRSGNVRVVDYAHQPSTPSVPNMPLNLTLGVVMGVIVGGTLAFVQDRLDANLRTPHQAEVISGLPLIGVVPKVAIAAHSRNHTDLQLSHASLPTIIAQPRPRMDLMESYRALRVSLLTSPGGPPQVILVTSALASEGKTTTSINCATVLAQKGARVLLVDADLRSSRIHKILGLRPSPGLSTILYDAVDGSRAHVNHPLVHYTRVPGLFVLTAGAIPTQPHRLLDSPVMTEMIGEWRRLYTHIVIDTPPILLASDALELSAEADSVLLAAFAGKTPKAALLRARDLLLSVGAKLKGIVVNGVDLKSPNYYGYGYGYGYSSYPAGLNGSTETENATVEVDKDLEARNETKS